MFIRVKSPPEELAEVYAAEEAKAKDLRSVEVFLSDRCAERMEIIHELSHELAELRWHYEQLCFRMKKYEPDFMPMVEADYDPDYTKVNLL